MTHYFWGKAIPDSLEETVEPSRTAIVAVDLQNDFAHKDGYSASYGDASPGIAVLAPNARLLDVARRASLFVTYTQQNRRTDGSTDTAGFLAKSLESGHEPRWCLEGTWGAEICEEVARQPQDVVVIKHRRSGFAGTNLDMILRDRGIRSVVVTGLALSGCVEATVRDAIELGYFVVVPRDCVSNYTAQGTADGLKTFERILIKGNLTTSETLMRIWSQGTGKLPRAIARKEQSVAH